MSLLAWLEKVCNSTLFQYSRTVFLSAMKVFLNGVSEHVEVVGSDEVSVLKV